MTRLSRWWLLTALGGLIAAGTVAWAGAGVPSAWRWAVLPLFSGGVIALTLTGLPIVLGAASRAGAAFGLHGPQPAPPARDLSSRTAILVPIHNEDPRRVFEGVRTMRTQVDAAGLAGVEFFVLSDTRDLEIAAEEEAEHAALSKGGTPVTYRRRTQNLGRKAGNIAEFCERSGAAFDYMLVLDADSVMGAGSIERLIGLMDANPRAGIIQTVPYSVNRETLHARLSQFAMRLYTPLWAEGAAFWHASDANYWGHNAIIRIAPFTQHARLPVLPGRAPLGGEILCHDVVEAALLRAQGWHTWLVPGVADSFEELPANMVDDAARERRWCQGNLQHIKLLDRAGLRAPARLHLGSGILYYLAAPCWIALMLLITLMPAASALAVAQALAAPLLTLFAVPKLFGLSAALASPRGSAHFGGRARLTASMALEQALGLLTTPGTILSTARFVAGTLSGAVVRWESQARSDRGLSWSEAWSRFGWHAGLGAVWGLVLLARDPTLFAWAAPIVAGLIASVPLAVMTSRLDLGRAARRMGLFLTEDEIQPSAVLRAHRAATASGMRPVIEAAWTDAPATVQAEPVATLS